LSDERFKAGSDVRRAVLGDQYVDSALAAGDGFNAEFQRLITEYCWGEIWTRDQLPRKIRSLLNIAMLAVLNRPNELRTHTQGALRNGCTDAEIAEVLLQATIYAGVPAGVDAFMVAREAIRDFTAENNSAPESRNGPGRF
jgi:4-carboxymuconolactone decarboxylase